MEKPVQDTLKFLIATAIEEHLNTIPFYLLTTTEAIEKE